MEDAAVVATLKELIAIPSIGGTDGEVVIQHRLAERLGDLGLDVDLWPIDLADLRRREDYPGEEVDRPDGVGPGRDQPTGRAAGPDPAGPRRRGAHR